MWSSFKECRAYNAKCREQLKKKHGSPLPEMSITSFPFCHTGRWYRTWKQSYWIRAASPGSFAANSKPVVPGDAESQSSTLPMGVLVLFNSLEQLESTQLTTTWAWKCLMIAYKIWHAMRKKVIIIYNRTHVQWHSKMCKFHNKF